ncbi:hypothetical protein BX616_003432 [Lobosporangium transversale]|nr:hypothetical protein BX616_003432 [Lobosporangium transversale]
MGVGKSYISWFLAAKAYAHGWPVLYIADANQLNNCDTNTDASRLICQLFLSNNKDTLTASELEEMVEIETSENLFVSSASSILGDLLQSRSQKALFVVDEHGALFPEKYSTVRFAKLILRDAPHYVEYVGPLSPDIFNKLLDVIINKVHPTARQQLNELRGEIQKATGYIEGIELAANGIKQRLKDYEEDRKEQFLETLKNCYNCSIVAARAVFDLFKQKERKTLFIIDEHGELFQKEPYVPDKYPFLKHLMNLNLWQSHYKGSRVIFTGTAHAKYELQIMEDSARAILLYFVGPLSETVFSKWLEVHLNQPDIVQDIMRITNRVPREFMFLIRSIEERPLTRNSIDSYVTERTGEFHTVVWTYYRSCSDESKKKFAKSLATVFLGNNSQSSDFEWDFRDLGLIYRLNKNRGAINYVLCPPVQKALFKAFTSMPHHEHILRGVVLAEMSGDDFELALLVRFLTLTKPIVLEATNLVGEDPTQIIMDFKDHGTIHQNMTSLGRGYGHVLSHCHSTYPRFDFILDTMFIQVSISNFQEHEKKQIKQIQNAFDKRGPDGRNQIESYLDEVFGGNHSAIIDDGHFVVKKDGEPVTGFKIVYMRQLRRAQRETF